MIRSALIRSFPLLVGLLFLAVSGLLFSSTKRFLDDAVTTDGTVVALDRYRSDGETRYRPVVEFTTDDGTVVEFTSSSGSSAGSHREGDVVSVLYRADDPSDAEIEGFATQWAAPIILGLLGSAFTALGVAVLIITRRSSIRRQQDDESNTLDPSHLLEDGSPIQATVVGVVTSAATASEPWWRLVAEWVDPQRQERREFVSGRVAIDPLPHVIDNEVRVFVADGADHYLVDMSFLHDQQG